jgi:broad specificity phosphatase PhoE
LDETAVEINDDEIRGSHLTEEESVGLQQEAVIATWKGEREVVPDTVVKSRTRNQPMRGRKLDTSLVLGGLDDVWHNLDGTANSALPRGSARETRVGRLILVRHGESLSNVTRIFATEPHDTPLTDLGYQQARETAEIIATRFDTELVVSSGYLRARETARIIAQRLGVPQTVEPRLHERDIGSYQGQPYDSILAAPGFDPTRPWVWKPEGGESFEEVRTRVAPILDRLAEAHRDRDVVVVSHGGVMTALTAHVAGQWPVDHSTPNGGIILVEHGPQGYIGPPVSLTRKAG